MKNTSKQKKIKEVGMQEWLKNIEKLFEELKKDASLPSFGEFFMTCLVMGSAERVNLKLLYPKLYNRLTAWIRNNNEQVMSVQKKQ